MSTDGRVVYAIGDIHGCYELMAALLTAIVSDIAELPSDPLPVIVFCGDYVDRGHRSRDVVAALVWISRNSPVDVIFLRGNHEAMLLDFIDQPERSLSWLQNDGEATLRSYGVDIPSSNDKDALLGNCRDLRDQLIDFMPSSHLTLLRGLNVTFMVGDYILVHAGLRPKVSISKQVESDCLWIREPFLENDYGFEKVVVHGHSWISDMPQITANRIGVDTGAYSTGSLTAVRLDGREIEFIQARQNSVDLYHDGSSYTYDCPGDR
jgi:serine/threonine protein phosphatase 1